MGTVDKQGVTQPKRFGVRVSLSKRYRTQWAAQFYVAAELTRRDCLVSLTLGNAPVKDLLVVNPAGCNLSVDVKGLADRNFWLIKRRTPGRDLFYVLVSVPKDGPPRFFIMSSIEVIQRIDRYKKERLRAGKRYHENMEGFGWADAVEHENRWSILLGAV